MQYIRKYNMHIFFIISLSSIPYIFYLYTVLSVAFIVVQDMQKKTNLQGHQGRKCVRRHPDTGTNIPLLQPQTGFGTWGLATR